MSLARLKWIAIVAPILFVGACQWLVAEFFEGEIVATPVHMVELGMVAVGGISFSIFLFRAVERIQRRVERQNAELSALNAVGHALSATHDLGSAMRSALGTLMSVTSATAAEIVVDDDGGHGESLTVSTGTPEDLGALRDTFAGERMAPVARAGNSKRTVAIVSIPASSEQSSDRAAAQVTCAEVPLVAQDVSVGSLRLLAPPSGNLRPGTSERLLAAMGNQLAVGIRAGNLFHDVLQRGDEAEALFGIGLQLASLQDTQKVLESVVRHASRLLGADAAALCLSGPQGGELLASGRPGPAAAYLRPAAEAGTAPLWVAWVEDGVAGHGDACEQCPVVGSPFRP